LTALLIARDGREFELPLAHWIHFYRGANERASYVMIDSPVHGASLFRVSEIEERSEAIVVHIADEISATGPAGSRGEPVSPLNGYPFP
jgi:hypothetical protein